MESYQFSKQPVCVDYFVLPLLGCIAAGEPIDALPFNEAVNIAKSVLGKDRYLLAVKGNSMIGDNICDGDLVVCQQCDTVPEGAIAVVLVDDDSATLKRVHYDLERGTITLIPSNPALLPIEYKAERITIQGLYIGLLRLHL
jgi:repressor LexA